MVVSLDASAAPGMLPEQVLVVLVTMEEMVTCAPILSRS